MKTSQLRFGGLASKRSNSSKQSHGSSFFSRPIQFAPKLDLAEREMHRVVEEIEDHVFRLSERPDIEMQILRFLTHALSPTTSGIANEMKIGVEAALVHLRELQKANRVWTQLGKGDEMTWHVSEEGRRFLVAMMAHHSEL